MLLDLFGSRSILKSICLTKAKQSTFRVLHQKYPFIVRVFGLFSNIYHLDTKQVMHNAANIDCLSSQSFTAFSLCILGFSDCYSYFFCLSCLWYLPSSSSSGLPQPSHGCPECKVVWCWPFLFSLYIVFFWGCFPMVFHPSVVAFVVCPVIFFISLCFDNTHHCFLSQFHASSFQNS